MWANMFINGFKLFTNNASLNPYVIAKYAYQKGYYTQAGTSWRLMDEGARCFGVNASLLFRSGTKRR